MKKVLLLVFILTGCEAYENGDSQNDNYNDGSVTAKSDDADESTVSEEMVVSRTESNLPDSVLETARTNNEYVPYSSTTTDYFTVYGSAAKLKTCLDQPCTNEGFYMEYDATANELGIFSVNNNTITQRMTIERSGNVGIGTTSPDYLFTVAGTIGAREIIVEADMADYVFQDGYYLRSLKEVEEHIQKNNHLPDMPSEADVDHQGLSLGDFNTLLLQKIEELTLYTIAQQKEIDNLKRDRQ